MSRDNSENDDTPHLDCPRCGSEMGSHQGRDGWLAACESCGGTWFDNGFCVAIAADEVWSDRNLIVEAEVRVADGPRRLDAGTPLNVGCPVCGERLDVSVIHGGVMIDACPSHGTFFDRDELRSYRVARSRQRVPTNRPASLETTQVVAAVMRRLERLHTTPLPGSDSAVMRRLERLHDTTSKLRLAKARSPKPKEPSSPPPARAPRELRCPGCAAPTKAWSSPTGLLAACPRCAGVWLDNSACVVLTDGRLLEADVAFVTRFEGHSPTQPAGPFRQASVPRACPICAKLLTPTQAEGMTIDTCLAHGMFFDAEELGQLHALYGEQARVEAAEAKSGTVSAWLRRTLGFRD